MIGISNGAMESLGINFPSGAALKIKLIAEAQIQEIPSLTEKFVKSNKENQVFCYYPSDKSIRNKLLNVIKATNKDEINIFPIDQRRILNKEFLYCKKLSFFMRKKSEKGEILLFVPEILKDALETLLPILFLRPLHSSPELVLLQLFKRKEILESDRIICEYLNYLNPNYQIPILFKKIETKLEHFVPKIQTKFSIRFKLLGITTILLTFSISVLIYFASLFFKETISVMVQDYNLSLARLLGDVVKSDIENLIYRADIFTNSSLNANTNNRQILKDEYFLNNPSVVWINIIQDEKSSKENSYFNTSYTKDYPFTEEEFLALIQERKEILNRTNLGSAYILNLTKYLDYPMLALVSPKIGKNSITTVQFVTPSYFLDSIRSSKQSDFFDLHIVDSQGNKIFSTNDTLDLRQFPIIAKMLSSGIDNGSQKFLHHSIAYLGSFRIIDKYGLGIISSVPEDKAFEAVYRIQNQNILLLLMTLSLTFVLVYLFAKTLSIPIIRLVSATEKIEHGILELDIEPTSNDEIGVLTSSFKHMANGLRERERIKEEFGKFVSPEIAERALKGEIMLGGEKKNCTVFFSDIRSFTAMSESKEPEEVVEILNEYFTQMVDCVHLTGGIVDKFIGDAVMAHWGSVVSHPSDPKNAVDSALLMRHALLVLNEKLVREGNNPIRIGCGINSGSVIAGQIGSQKRLEFTVIGDAVNLASRVEYLNKDFGTDILISESTYQELNGEYDCIPMKEILVRGKEKPQKTYAVLGKFTDETRPKDLDALRKLVGIPDLKEEHGHE